MSFWECVLIAIAAIVLIIVALFFIIKGLLLLIYWFFMLLPTIIKTTIYWAIIVMVCLALRVMEKIPEIPGVVYLVLYFVIMGLIFARRYAKHGYLVDTSGGEYQGYVVNKRTKAIHSKYSDSADTISDRNRREVSYSEAMDLVRNNEKYHFKKDS